MSAILNNGVFPIDQSPEPARDWNAYVENAADASFYHRYEWQQINESEFGHQTFYLAHYEDNQITGVLPLVLLRSRIFGRLLCSLPFLNYCGPSAHGDDTVRALMEEACTIANRERARYLEVRSTRLCDPSLPVSTAKISLTVMLNSDPGALWTGFTRKHRKNIRRSYKSGLRVEHGHAEMLDIFYEIICQSWRALGTPIYRKSYFRSILEVFGDRIRIFVVYQGDTPVAAAFCAYDKGIAEGMWAGEVPEYRNLNSNYVLYWEMIKLACEAGLDRFHLGRSSADSGGETFKRKWGATAQQLYSQYYLPDGGEIPQLNVNNPKYKLAIAAWRKMPLWATRLLGPTLARSIP